MMDAHRTLKVKKNHTEARIPTRGSKLAGGLDLYAVGYISIPPGERGTIATGICMAVPEGMVGIIHPRSSTFLKGIDVSGVIDADFVGQVYVMVHNHSDDLFVVQAGDRVAQMVLVDAHLDIVIDEVKALPETGRGSNGFGSTGR